MVVPEHPQRPGGCTVRGGAAGPGVYQLSEFSLCRKLGFPHRHPADKQTGHSALWWQESHIGPMEAETPVNFICKGQESILGFESQFPFISK